MNNSCGWNQNMITLKPRINLRRDLPYGMWCCADGRQVLFNREYKPIWERRGGPAVAAAGSEWVEWLRQEWFYGELDAPWYSRAMRKRCDVIQEQFKAGFAVTAPIRFAIERDDTRARARVVFERFAESNPGYAEWARGM